ncbi:MAG TPA: GntR family transcriptional regulator, partial [Nocardioides sp.]|nr:GntR family transcriptional regulator [Nocardioides sp.]
SRIPVREALRELAHEGLAEERATRGMVVRRLDPADVAALFEVRGALEDLLCERIVAHASDADLNRLDEVLGRARDAVRRGAAAEARELNAEFHVVLAELAGPVVAAVMEPVAGRMRWVLTQHEDPADMVRAHEQIARSLRRRDLESARHELRLHLLDSRAEVDARLS